MKIFVLCFILISSAFAMTTIKSSKSLNDCNEKICIGDKVTVKSDLDFLNNEFIFAGQTVLPNQSVSGKIFINTLNNKLFFISENEITKSKDSFQNIIDSYPQVGGTCTGYALFNYLIQLNISGLKGNLELKKVLSSEEGRSQLLADTINQYYLVTQHRYSILGILNSYGKKFGFKCSKTMSNDKEKLINKIKAENKMNNPLLIAFNIGKNMSESPLELSKYFDNLEVLDQRIWTPRKIGDRNNGGHSVVIANGIEIKNDHLLMMIDSDWEEPRIWSINEIFNPKVATDEIELYSCK